MRHDVSESIERVFLFPYASRQPLIWHSDLFLRLRLFVICGEQFLRDSYFSKISKYFIHVNYLLTYLIFH